MEPKLRESHIKRSVTALTNSFKMSQSVLTGGGGNRKVVNLKVANIKLYDKNDYKKQEVCQVCFVAFSTLNRQHHCRICANAVCSSCSVSSINKERACDTCAYHYLTPEKLQAKMKILEQLAGIATLYVQNKAQIEQELKKLTEQQSTSETLQKMKEKSAQKLENLNSQLNKIREQRLEFQEKIKQLENRGDLSEIIS